MRKKTSRLQLLITTLAVLALVAPAPALATDESAKQDTKSEAKSAPPEPKDEPKDEQKPERKGASRMVMRPVEEPQADASPTPAKDPRCLFRDEAQPKANFNTLEDLYSQLLTAIEQHAAEQPQPDAPQIIWREVAPEE